MTLTHALPGCINALVLRHVNVQHEVKCHITYLFVGGNIEIAKNNYSHPCATIQSFFNTKHMSYVLY